MIVDSSAIVAMVLREDGYLELVDKLQRCGVSAIGSPTLVEASLVLRSRLRTDPTPILDRLLRDFDLSIVEFGELHWRAASDAFARYGKGRHAAALNFGDCMSYAVARLAHAPLLYVGDDFAQTDITAA